MQTYRDNRGEDPRKIRIKKAAQRRSVSPACDVVDREERRRVQRAPAFQQERLSIATIRRRDVTIARGNAMCAAYSLL